MGWGNCTSFTQCGTQWWLTCRQPQPAAASLLLATQTEACTVASDAQAAAGAVVAKAAAGSEEEPAGADASKVTLHLVKGLRPLPKKGHLVLRKLRPQVSRQSPLPRRDHLLLRTLRLPSQKAAAANQKALCSADTAIGSAVAQLAEPDDIAVTEAKPIAAVKTLPGASQAVFLDVTGTSPPAFRKLMLEDGTTVEPALASIAENNLSIFIHGIRPQDPHWWPVVSS